MSQKQPKQQTATLRVRNVGGIDETELSIEPGVTALTGRNATNRTSLLQAFMAALGSDAATLKADAEEGRAELEIGGETYDRTLTRAGSSIVTDGEPYLEDPQQAELFAFLLESNDARRAVMTKGDLREIILQPVDTEAIESNIRRRANEKREITQDIERLDDLKDRLPELEEERTKLESKIDDKRSELEDVQETIEATDAEQQEQSDKPDELDEKLDELSELRSSLEDVRFDLETERESLEAIQDNRAELLDEREALSVDDTRDVSEIEAEIERLQSREQSLDEAVRQLQNIVQFNEEMLEGTHPEVREALSTEDDSGTLTDQLVDDGVVTCWTCGSEVERETIEATIDRVRSLQQSKLNEQKQVEDEIETLRADRDEIEQVRERKERLTREIESADNEIETREERIEELREQRSELEADIELVEDEVDELESETSEQDDADEGESLLDLNKRANQLEFELGRLERELETTVEEIEEIEAELETESELKERREEIVEELETLRTRIERIEQDAIDSFNEQMDALLDVLAYDNLARIWIERVADTGSSGGRGVEQASFSLHVVRSTDDGQAYEDTIDHLSESEREVTGLVFALAGYLAHEVYETVPFMLLDSLEAIDSDRIALLIEHFEEFTDFLVVALLPEDSAALPDRHDRIREI
ncbi:AAA domain-containing protein [Natronoarchaeum philippinense]|uniref:AAA domain-containing protein n=1 Tax=Natronoarchaeum philippinense TaxID=558529 RepID=A0A285P5K1_NATPI|nr:archaea-specific SMC-related protein [Natronoarchaeum philippinense]SNZ17012.1 AAA domain-containing protein [Natronoarchaeum philippinense]